MMIIPKSALKGDGEEEESRRKKQGKEEVEEEMYEEEDKGRENRLEATQYMAAWRQWPLFIDRC